MSRAKATGQVVYFVPFDETSFEYIVTASMTGDRSFSGIVRDSGDPPDVRLVGGEDKVVVEAAVDGTPEVTPEPTPTETETPGVGTTASASRSFEPNTNTVDTGGELMVTITAVDYGLVGRVVETLPPGFRYMDGSVDPSGIRVKVEEDQVEDQVVTFSLLGETSFTYTVTASSTAKSYTFSGTLYDVDRVDRPVGGDSMVMVVVSGASASRSFEPNTNTVDTGGELMVTITAVDYGLVGRVVEMLPPGFRYMDGSIDPSGIRVKVEEDQVEDRLSPSACWARQALRTPSPPPARRRATRSQARCMT